MDWKLILCMGLAAAGLLFGLSQWLRARRQLANGMDRMLDRAIDGSFLESSFDESVPSALESKMARFLNGSASSARNLAEEKEQDRGSDRRRVPPDQDPHRQSAAVRLPAGGERADPGTAGPGRGPEDPGGETLLPGGCLGQSPPGWTTGILHSVPSTCTPSSPCWMGRPRRGCARRRTAWHFPHCRCPGRARPALTPSGRRKPLYNVLDNAVKYTPPGGTVTLSVTALPYASAASRCADTGPGIPEEEQAQIFSRFYRGSRRPGAGRAGAWASTSPASILTSEGGYIQGVLSARERACTFSLYLPLE